MRQSKFFFNLPFTKSKTHYDKPKNFTALVDETSVLIKNFTFY